MAITQIATIKSSIINAKIFSIVSFGEVDVVFFNILFHQGDNS